MPLYVADYLADTAHLTAAEHGAYLLLIMHYWRAGKLPSDERQLARIARMTTREWANSRDVLAGFFDAEWRHKRIESEIAKSARKSDARADAGSRGGKAKALKTNDADLANATILLEQTCKQTDGFALASSSHSHSDKEKPSVLERADKLAPKPRKPSADEKVFDILTHALSEANARAVIEHRRAKGAKLTERAAELLVAEFFKAHNPDDAAETMIAQGWQGFNVDWYRRAKPGAKVIDQTGTH
jgi:uncharacterized protein YdaU (DUF1376 family)